MTRDDAYRLVSLERARQRAKWGGCHDWGRGDCSSLAVPDIVKVAVLGEEFGEVARAVLERDTLALRRELTHVGAVSVAWLESLPAEEHQSFAAAAVNYRDGTALSQLPDAAGVTDGSIGDQTRDPARTPPTATASPEQLAASEVASEPTPTASNITTSNTTTTAAPAAGSRAVACREER